MRVPFLRSGESGEHDYEADRRAKSFLNLGAHSIQPQQSPREEDELGVMGKHQEDAIKAEQKRQLLLNDPEYRAEKERRRVFDQAKIMDASVRLREENERNDAELAGLAGIEVGKMVEKKKAFLDSLRRNMDKDFSSGDSSDWFGKMFEAYAGKELASTQSWMDDRVKEYAIVSGKKQRDAFADMATRPHVLFDDVYQMDMRNMRLLNIDTTYRHLPEGELAEKRDEANAEFYERVFAKRLEVDPESARRFASDPVVRRAFTPEQLDAFDKRGEAATREMTFEATGFSWAEEGIDPAEAAKRANDLWKDKADREAALERYAGFAYARNAAKAQENARSIVSALKESHQSGYDPDSIPSSVRLGDPELYEILRKDRAIRRKNGGEYPEADYAYLLEIVGDFDPDAAARTFADRRTYGEAVLRLGGPDSPLVAALDAMVQGKATKEMRKELADLAVAAEYASRLTGGKLLTPEDTGDSGALNEFLSQFSAWKRVYLSRSKQTELDPNELRELAGKTAESMDWKETTGNNNPPRPDGGRGGRPRPPSPQPTPQNSPADRGMAGLVEHVMSEPPVNADDASPGDLVKVEGERQPIGDMPPELLESSDSLTPRHILESGVDNPADERDNHQLFPSPATAEEIRQTTDPEGRRIVDHSVGKAINFHGDWGEIKNIQGEGIIKRLNFFFRDPRSREYFPAGITVRAHPNGKSLVYEWLDRESGTRMHVQQTARPSWQLTAKNIFGDYLAEETPWGFTATEEFDGPSSTDSDKAQTAVHEFLHQAFQMHKTGKMLYLLKHRGEFIANLTGNIFKNTDELKYPHGGKIFDAYRRVSLEEAAHSVSDLFKNIEHDYKERE